MKGIHGWFKKHLGWVLLGVAGIILIVFCNLHDPVSMRFWNHLTYKSEALAAWVAALATVVLAFGLWLTMRSMRISAQVATFQIMYERFNAPNMRYARAVLAKTHLQHKVEEPLKDLFIPSVGWLIIGFLNQVGKLIEDERLDFEDVELIYADHVMAIGERCGTRVNDESHLPRYAPFCNMYKKMKESNSSHVFRNELDVYYDRAFWECEESLDATAKAEC